jgi:DNA-directed RNA polymerase specialized sigma subunit
VGLQQDVLRELVTEYKKSKDTTTFSKVLKRVDKLLLFVIHKHVRQRPHLGKVELRDLYHSAIIGLGRAMLTSHAYETGDKLVARIIAYVKCELNNTYPLNTIRRFCTFVSLEGEGEICVGSKVEENVEFTLLCDRYIEMLMQGHISHIDSIIFLMRFGNGDTYREIGVVIGTSEQNARERANRIFKKVQKWFEKFDYNKIDA